MAPNGSSSPSARHSTRKAALRERQSAHIVEGHLSPRIGGGLTSPQPLQEPVLMVYLLDLLAVVDVRVQVDALGHRDIA
jgi:hypothetical protein